MSYQLCTGCVLCICVTLMGFYNTQDWLMAILVTYDWCNVWNKSFCGFFFYWVRYLYSVWYDVNDIRQSLMNIAPLDHDYTVHSYYIYRLLFQWLYHISPLLYVLYYTVSITNTETSHWQHHCHLMHWRLSLWQPSMHPMAMKLSKWSPLMFKCSTFIDNLFVSAVDLCPIAWFHFPDNNNVVTRESATLYTNIYCLYITKGSILKLDICMEFTLV